jgi:hypothetical protein
MTTRAPRPGVGHDRWPRVTRVKSMPRGSRLASPDAVPRIQGRRHKGWEGAGNRRSNACSVNRFVNRTRRDRLRRGRRNRRSEMGSVLSAEVTAPARDGLRRGDARRMAHNPATTGNASMRHYVPRTRCNRQSKPASGALREACSSAPVASPAQIARQIAATALIALGFRSEPFHDPFHE